MPSPSSPVSPPPWPRRPGAAQAAAPAATPLQKVSAAVEPSIVYMETTFEAAVKDPKWGFIGGEKNFSVTYTCSGSS